MIVLTVRSQFSDLVFIALVVQTIPVVSFHKRCLYRNSYSMEISFHSHLDSNKVITTKFCKWHDRCVSCNVQNMLRSDGP